MIRQAKKEDVNEVTEYLYIVLSDMMMEITGNKSKEESMDFLKSLYLEPETPYSYADTIVYCQDGQVMGALCYYEGKNFRRFRDKVYQMQYEKYGTRQEIFWEDESKEGEIYLDTLAVGEKYRGHNIGTKLIKYVLEQYKDVKDKKITLIADEKKSHLAKIYHGIGFEDEGMVSILDINYRKMHFTNKK